MAAGFIWQVFKTWGEEAAMSEIRKLNLDAKILAESSPPRAKGEAE